MRQAVKLLCVFLMIFLLTACTTYNDSFVYENMTFVCSKLKNDCFVAEIYYEKGGETNIVIPDEYEGYTVKALGGYYGTGVPIPFGIILACEYQSVGESLAASSEKFAASEEILYTDFFKEAVPIVEDVVFNITLPSGLKEINCVFDGKAVYCEKSDNDGSITVNVTRPIWRFEISEENDFFYTENGRLYNKETNELIDDFTYEGYKSEKN